MTQVERSSWVFYISLKVSLSMSQSSSSSHTKKFLFSGFQHPLYSHPSWWQQLLGYTVLVYYFSKFLYQAYSSIIGSNVNKFSWNIPNLCLTSVSCSDSDWKKTNQSINNMKFLEISLPVLSHYCNRFSCLYWHLMDVELFCFLKEWDDTEKYIYLFYYFSNDL